MNGSLIKSKKSFLTCVLLTATMYCSAQKQLLSYQDIQYIVQNNTAAVTSFLQQKEYHLQSSSNGEARFFSLIADADYNDVNFNAQGKHTILTLLTTDLPQLKLIESELQNRDFKNTKNGKLYRIKSDAISTISIKPPETAEKIYTIRIEN